MRNRFFRLPVLLALVLPALARAQAGEEEIRRRGAVLRRTVTKMTGLEFKRKVPMGLYSKEQLRKFLIRELRLSLPPHVAENWERIGVCYGFWKRDFDLVKSYTALLTENVAGFYHPREKQLKIIPNEGPKSLQERALERALGIRMSDVYLLHELYHAAQDQNFGLLKLKTVDEKNDDMIAAFEAVIEGEATRLHYRYMFKDRYPLARAQIGALPPLPPGKPYPRVLYYGLVFPYTLGFRFMDRVVERRGWKCGFKMFFDLPLSTEMVLHPEKYLRKDRDYPQVISLRFAKISKQLGNAWTRLDDNVHGEFVIRLMFDEFGLSALGRKAAAGWDGDRYTVYHRAADDRLLGIWVSTWDSEEEAREFGDAYTVLLGKKYEGFKPKEGNPGLYSTEKNGLVLLERRGADVLVIEGADEADLEIVPLIWKHLKKKELRGYRPRSPLYF